MRRSYSSISVLLGAVFLEACSLVFASELDDAAGSSPQSFVDAIASPEAQASETDGGDDAAITRDADTAPDAPSAPDADAEPPPGCTAFTPAPKFCRDFDTGTVADGWDGIAKPQGSQVELATERRYSGARATKVVSAAGGSCANTVLQRELTGVGTRVKVGARIFPQSPWGGGNLLKIEIGSGAGECSLFLNDAANDTQRATVFVQSSSPQDTRGIDGRLTNDAWTGFEVELEPDPDGVGVVMHFTVTSAAGVPSRTSHTFEQCSLSTRLELSVGHVCSTDASVTYYDDIRVDW